MAKKKKIESPHPRISPLLAFCLGAVTLGVYSYIWTSRRYRESSGDPEWSSHWLIPVGICVVVIVIGINLTTLLPHMFEDAVGASIAAYGYYVLWGIAWISTAGWLAVYMTRICESHRTALVLMACTFSPLAVYYLQGKLNHQDGADDAYIRWLSVLVAIVFCVGIVATVYSRYPVNETKTQLEEEFRITHEYLKCHEELGVKYPNDEVGAYQYPAYVEAYENCEAIIY